jgi:hypothetical protein
MSTQAAVDLVGQYALHFMSRNALLTGLEYSCIDQVQEEKEQEEECQREE